MNEFDLIRHFFQSLSRSAHVPLGIGDDCALVEVQSGDRLAVSTDMLISGQHFFEDVDPFLLGHKVAAVNLSDLAAMGADPLGILLSVGLVQNDLKWIESFSKGLMHCLNLYHCPLIGGDTCASSLLTLNATVLGAVPCDVVLARSSAQVGDVIWVSGVLGGAGYALQMLFAQRAGAVFDQKGLSLLRHRLEQPIPRIALGKSLRDLAHAVIDVSDGLFQDLGHILEQSHVGAQIDLNAIAYEPYFDECPIESFVLKTQPCAQYLSDVAKRAMYSCCTGEDYELCFTAPECLTQKIQEVGHCLGISLCPIGHIVQGSDLLLLDDQTTIPLSQKGLGFNHF